MARQGTFASRCNHTHAHRFLTLLAMVGVATGCTDRDQVGTASPHELNSPTRTTKIIGQAGGTVALGEQAVVEIPAGALEREVEITIERCGQDPGLISDMFCLEPDGTQFTVPVTVALAPRRPLSLRAIRHTHLVVREGDRWLRFVASAVDERGLVAARTTHFSGYGLVLDEPSWVVGEGGRAERDGVTAACTGSCELALHAHSGMVLLDVSAPAPTSVLLSGLPPNSRWHLSLNSGRTDRVAVASGDGSLALDVNAGRSFWMALARPGTAPITDQPSCEAIVAARANGENASATWSDATADRPSRCALPGAGFAVEGALVVSNPGILLDCLGAAIQPSAVQEQVGITLSADAQGASARSCVLRGFDLGVLMAGSGQALYDLSIEAKYGGVAGIGTDQQVYDSDVELQPGAAESYGIFLAISAAQPNAGHVVAGNQIHGQPMVGIESTIWLSPVPARITGNDIDGTSIGAIVTNVVNAEVVGNSALGSGASLVYEFGPAIEFDPAHDPANARQLIQHNNFLASDAGGLKLVATYGFLPTDQQGLDYPLDASHQGQGNFWGHTNPPLFERGVDSNQELVFDSAPYCRPSGWLRDSPPGECLQYTPPDDSDGDGVPDAMDTCPGIVSSLADSDVDGRADACDNCPDAANANQQDLDGDGLGDACDPDTSLVGDQGRLSVTAISHSPEPWVGGHTLESTVRASVSPEAALGGSSSNHRFFLLTAHRIVDEQGVEIGVSGSALELDRGSSGEAVVAETSARYEQPVPAQDQQLTVETIVMFARLHDTRRQPTGDGLGPESCLAPSELPGPAAVYFQDLTPGPGPHGKVCIKDGVSFSTSVQFKSLSDMGWQPDSGYLVCLGRRYCSEQDQIRCGGALPICDIENLICTKPCSEDGHCAPDRCIDGKCAFRNKKLHWGEDIHRVKVLLNAESFVVHGGIFWNTHISQLEAAVDYAIRQWRLFFHNKPIYYYGGITSHTYPAAGEVIIEMIDGMTSEEREWLTDGVAFAGRYSTCYDGRRCSDASPDDSCSCLRNDEFDNFLLGCEQDTGEQSAAKIWIRAEDSQGRIRWSLGLRENESNRTIDVHPLAPVLMHEFGHTFGLNHTCNFREGDITLGSMFSNSCWGIGGDNTRFARQEIDDAYKGVMMVGAYRLGDVISKRHAANGPHSFEVKLLRDLYHHRQLVQGHTATVISTDNGVTWTALSMATRYLPTNNAMGYADIRDSNWDVTGMQLPSWGGPTNHYVVTFRLNGERIDEFDYFDHRRSQMGLSMTVGSNLGLGAAGVAGVYVWDSRFNGAVGGNSRTLDLTYSSQGGQVGTWHQVEDFRRSYSRPGIGYTIAGSQGFYVMAYQARQAEEIRVRFSKDLWPSSPSFLSADHALVVDGQKPTTYGDIHVACSTRNKCAIAFVHDGRTDEALAFSPIVVFGHVETNASWVTDSVDYFTPSASNGSISVAFEGTGWQYPLLEGFWHLVWAEPFSGTRITEYRRKPEPRFMVLPPEPWEEVYQFSQWGSGLSFSLTTGVGGILLTDTVN